MRVVEGWRGAVGEGGEGVGGCEEEGRAEAVVGVDAWWVGHLDGGGGVVDGLSSFGLKLLEFRAAI